MFEIEGIDHIAIRVRDVERSVAWYQAVLGLERMYEEAWGDEPAVVGTGNTSVAIFGAPGTPERRDKGANEIDFLHLAFRVDSINFDAAQRSLSDRRIPFSFEDHGISHSIYLQDPDGHRLEITMYLEDM